MIYKCKSKKKRHKYKKMTKDDSAEIELLIIQKNIIYLYMIADLAFFVSIIEKINDCNDGGMRGKNRIIGDAISLIASIYLLKVTITRYNNLYIRKINNEFKYSIEPNRVICIAVVYIILMYSILLIGDILRYMPNNNRTVEENQRSKSLLSTEANMFIIRAIADYIFLKAITESIELIRSKSDPCHSQKTSPDLPAVIANELYLIQRTVLAGIFIYEYVIFRDNGYEVIANIIGVGAYIINLNAFVYIYNQNIDEPVFGR